MSASREFAVATPETEFIDVDLVARPLLGKAERVERLRRRLSMGLPILTPLPAFSMEGDILDSHIKDEQATSDFYLLHLIVTIRPDDSSTIEELGVSVTLSPLDTSTAALPIAWSLFPRKEATAVTVSDQVGVRIKLGVIEPEMSRNVDKSHDEPYALGFGERESSFEWRFKSPSKQPLISGQRMYAIVKAPKGTGFQAQVIVSASARTKPFGLNSYRADLPPYAAIITHAPKPTSAG